MNKKTIKILVIVSIVLMLISAITNLFPQDTTIQMYQEIYANIGLNMTADAVTNILRMQGIITIITSVGAGVYGLLVLNKATKKSTFIAPGILLIIFNGLFGIIAGIMMLCLKQEEINK